METTTAVVIDMGSTLMKCGLNDEDTPRAIFSNVVGRTKDANRSILFGDDAKSKQPVLDLVWPVQLGVITNWDDAERILRYAFNDRLKVATSERPVLLTERKNCVNTAYGNPGQNRERITKLMFEAFNVPAFYLGSQPSLSLLALGRDTGIVLDSGFGSTSITPIVDGQIQKAGVAKLGIAGQALSKYATKLLTDRKVKASLSDLQFAGNDIKEKYGFAALDYIAELERNVFLNLGSKINTYPKKIDYKMPDGQTVKLQAQPFQIVEPLFQPKLVGSTESSIDQLIFSVVMKCEDTVRKLLYENISLAGGSTMFSNLNNRLQMSVSGLAPPTSVVKITDVPSRQYIGWTGGATMTNMSTFESMWITKQEYQERGSSIVHQKCPV